MRGLFGSLRNMGMNAADALDFIPGFDPVPEQQGAVRGMFGSLAPRGAAQTPPIIPQGMTAPKQVQPVQKRGMMAQPPGGVPVTGLERYSKPLTLPQLLTMSGNSRRAYNQGRDAHSATKAQMQFDMQQGQQSRQQAQMAAQQAALERQNRIEALMGMGLNQYQAEIYADDPEAFREEYAKNYAPQSLSPNDEVYTFGNDTNPLTNSNTGTVNEIDQQNADAATLSAEASMARAGQQRNGITIGPDGTVRIGGTANQTLTGPSDPESDYIQASTALASSQETHQTMMSSIDKALDQVGILTAGPGALLSSVPGTPARDMQATLDTVRANLGFEKLQEMRENSPTGGALGQVTERELAFLQAVRGSLDSMQSPQQLRETLVDIRASLERLQENREKAFTQRYQVGAPGTPRTVFDPAAVAEGDLSALSDEDLDAAIEALGGGG